MEGIDMSKVKFVQVVDDDYEDDEEEIVDDRDKENKQPSKRLKTLFKPEIEIDSLYTGGTIQISKNGKYLISQCVDKINVVDIESGSIKYKLHLDTKITTFSLNKENTEILIGCSNLQLRQYKLDLNEIENDIDSSNNLKDKESVMKNTTAAIIKIWKGHDSPINSIDFHSSDVLAVTGSSDRTVKVWDIEKGYCTHNFTEGLGVVSIVKFHPNKLQVISASDDLNIRVWDLNTKQSTTLSGHLSLISGISFSNSGNELISVGRDKVINVWDMISSSPKKTIPIFQELGGIITLPRNIIESNNLPEKMRLKLEKATQKVMASPQADKVQKNGLTVIVGGEEVTRAWCIETSECVWNDQDKEFKKKTDKTQNDEPVFLITAILSSDNQIFTVTSEHNIMVYDINTLNRQGDIIGFNDEITDIKYVGGASDFEKIIVATNSNDIRYYDINTLKAEILRGHQDIVMSLDVSHDGKFLLSGSKDKSVLLWDLEKKSIVQTFKGHTANVTCVALPKKSNLFAISASDDKTIKLWKLANEGKQQKQQAILTKVAHEKDINCVVVAPNDKIFATCSQDGYVKIWSTNDFSLLTSIKAHKRGVWNVEFSPVEQILMTCSSDGSIKIWSLTDFSCIRTLEGHQGSVLRASFVSFGMQILSVGSEGLVKLWNIKTSECVNTFEAHESKIWALAINKKDQDYFITGGSDSKIIVWRDHTILEEEREKQEKDNLLLTQQTLSTCIRNKDYLNALRLALVLNQPRQTLNIFQEMYNENGNDSNIAKTIPDLQSHELLKCLRYIRDWNTNSKFSQISQTLLKHILISRRPFDFIKLSTNEIPTILQSLIPYTERHFQRIDKMLQKTYLIDYTISNINPSSSTILIDESNSNTNNVDKKKKEKSKKK